MRIDRRTFLRSAAAVPIASALAAGLPTAMTARAASAGGYKALVCVFLFGGLDAHDLLLPHDEASYGAFARARQSLLAGYGETRARDALLPLTPDDAGRFGSRRFALPPETPRLHALFGEGRAAIVANVGPLVEPVTAAAYASGGAALPPRLFSHNDQQATWQASAPEGAQLGWGGLFADAVLAAGANDAPVFTTLATTGVGPFLTGRDAAPYQISVGAPAGIRILEGPGGGQQRAFEAFLARARDRFRAEGFDGSNVLAQDVARMFRDGIDANEVFEAARANAPFLDATFPETGLGAQLRAVAETISVRSALGAARQVFFVGIGGFDTHSRQASDLPPLLTQIDGALGAFYDATAAMGVSQDVTTFTASDFGRTLVANGDGTDHGWGGHSIVLGGSVRGRQILGDVPPPELGHEQDAGSGRLIPTLAVEQLADPLGRWWGLSAGEVEGALPTLDRFDPANLALF